MPKAKVRGNQKIEKVMGEFKRGTLKSGGSGKIVPKSRPDIAKAIAMSEQRRTEKKKKG